MPGYLTSLITILLLLPRLPLINYTLILDIITQINNLNFQSFAILKFDYYVTIIFYMLFRQRFQFLYLFDEICFLIIELFIFWSIFVKFRKEIYEFLLISQQNVQDRLRLVGICHKHFKKTWKASNWMFLDFSFSIFIISFRLSGDEMYLVITVKLCRSRSNSPSNFKLCRRVT